MGLQELGFGKCALSVQAPIKDNVKDPMQLSGARIVTSYPSLTKSFFDPLDAKTGRTTSEPRRQVLSGQ